MSSKKAVVGMPFKRHVMSSPIHWRAAGFSISDKCNSKDCKGLEQNDFCDLCEYCAKCKKCCEWYKLGSEKFIISEFDFLASVNGPINLDYGTLNEHNSEIIPEHDPNCWYVLDKKNPFYSYRVDIELDNSLKYSYQLASLKLMILRNFIFDGQRIILTDTSLDLYKGQKKICDLTVLNIDGLMSPRHPVAFPSKCPSCDYRFNRKTKTNIYNITSNVSKLCYMCPNCDGYIDWDCETHEGSLISQLLFSSSKNKKEIKRKIIPGVYFDF